jgi:hypothetical protein
MSYISGKKNLYSLISNEVIKYHKSNIQSQSINKELNTQYIKVLKDPDQPTLFINDPKNLISNSSLNINSSSQNCLYCLLHNGITQDDLSTSDSYIKNIDNINKVRNSECQGVCTNNIENINLSTNLLFSTGVSINLDNATTKTISDNISNKLSSISKQTSHDNSGPNGLWLLFGIAGVLPFMLSPTDTNTINEQVKKSVYNISQLYSNTINQLISSSQNVTILGSGVKVKNVSLSSIQDITMSASQANCADGSTAQLSCVDGSISDITNSLLSVAFKGISSTSSSLLSYAFNQNKTLIFVLIGVVVVSTVLYLYLLINKSLNK